MKNYKVKIKKYETTDMIVVAENKDEAVLSVQDLLDKCVEERVDLSKVFTNKPNFIFEVEELDVDV